MRRQLNSINFGFTIILVVLFAIQPILSRGALAAVSWQQTNFWFRDDDGAQAATTGYGSADTEQNNNISNVFAETAFRLRFSLKATSDSGTITPRLEFKQGNDCATGAWAVVTSTSDIFSLRLSPNFNDGDATTQQISSGQFTAGKILESSNPGPALTLSQNRSTEYEWSLMLSNSAPLDTTYSFRITNNGTALNTYNVCPTLTTQLSSPPPSDVLWNQTDFWFRDDNGGEISATGLGEETMLKNTSIILNDQNDFNRKKVFRLRFGLRAQQDSGAIKPRLEFRQGDLGCGGENGWSVIGASTNRFSLRDSLNLINRTLTSQQITTGAGFVPGLFLDTENPYSFFHALNKNEKTEYEWSLEDKITIDFTPNQTYSFRVTNNGTPLGLYSACPSISFGNGPSGQPTEVKFSGQAYPESKITIYVKEFGAEFPLKQEEINSPDGRFKTSYIGIIQNFYNYSLIVTDKNNRFSQIKSFNLDVYANSLSAKNIFFSPTLEILRPVVTKGDFITMLGNAGPLNKIEFEIDNGLASGETLVSEAGSFRWLLNTAGFNHGMHQIKARQVDDLNQKSDWSPMATFRVSLLKNPAADFSGDNIIDVKDWSIFLLKWNSGDEKTKNQLDLNGDGRIDVSDFSIFIRNL